MTTPQPIPADLKLAPPGAGIPAIERLIGGTLFALRRRVGSTSSFATQFARERALIRDLYTRAPQYLTQRTLIPRLRGLEDSSRYWSVTMTLDHLRIVNLQIARVIDYLARGISPGGVASTAAVKPSPDVTLSVVPEYESSCDQIASIVNQHPNLRTSLRYAHPWFGPLDAFGWHAMSAMHMGIHRAQIARILVELNRSPS